MARVREQAGVLIDTSDLALKDLKRTLEGHFALDDRTGPTIFVTSFSFRRGLPRDADLSLRRAFCAQIPITMRICGV